MNYKTPTDIHLLTEWSDIVLAHKQMYKYKKKSNSKSLAATLLEDTHVRVVAAETTQSRFAKESNVLNTREIFKIGKIKKTNPITYILHDLENKKIEGSFYREELIPVVDSGRYRIEVLKTRKRKGKIEYFVKYIDYPASKPEWVKSLE